MKTKTEILNTAQTILKQANAMPLESAFGECNRGEIRRMYDLVEALNAAAENKPYDNQAVHDYVNSKPSIIDDCL